MRKEFTPSPTAMNVVALRKKLGLKQLDLATIAKVDLSTLSKFENGKYPSMGKDSLRRIAEALNTTVEVLQEYEFTNIRIGFVDNSFAEFKEKFENSIKANFVFFEDRLDAVQSLRNRKITMLLVDPEKYKYNKELIPIAAISPRLSLLIYEAHKDLAKEDYDGSLERFFFELRAVIEELRDKDQDFNLYFFFDWVY